MTVQGIASNDCTALTELKAMFLQSMLKSMCMGEHFLDESSPFRAKDHETFQDILDAQYTSTIAGSDKGIGLAAVLSKQLESVAAPADKPASQVTESKQFSEVENNKPAIAVDNFIKSIWPKAKEAASLIGLDPKILMAQTVLETGWGKFITKDAEGNSTNNLFNIKAGTNSEYDSVGVKTTEYIADTPFKMNASFRKYPSVEHSFNDYISLIKGSERYQGALASAGNPENYVNELHKAGYATDPEYSMKILSIYHGAELNQVMQRCGIDL